MSPLSGRKREDARCTDRSILPFNVRSMTASHYGGPSSRARASEGRWTLPLDKVTHHSDGGWGGKGGRARGIRPPSCLVVHFASVLNNTRENGSLFLFFSFFLPALSRACASTLQARGETLPCSLSIHSPPHSSAEWESPFSCPCQHVRPPLHTSSLILMRRERAGQSQDGIGSTRRGDPMKSECAPHWMWEAGEGDGWSGIAFHRLDLDKRECVLQRGALSFFTFYLSFLYHHHSKWPIFSLSHHSRWLMRRLRRKESDDEEEEG